MAEKGIVSWKFGEALKSIYNERVKNRFWKRGFKRLPSQSRRGEVTAYRVKQELNSEFALNKRLIDALQKIEANWKHIERLVWGEQDSIVAYYKALSFLTDPKIVGMETGFFKNGTGFSAKPIEQYGADQTDVVQVKKYSIGIAHEIHLEPGGRQIDEFLSVIGHSNISGILQDWNRLYEMWRSRAEKTGDAGVLRVMEDLNGLFNEQLPKIAAREQEFQQTWLKNASAYHTKFEAMRGDLEKSRPKNIRFYHTYKIIAPVIKNPNFDPANPKNGPETLQFSDYYPDFRRDDEVEAGLDENGYPLEVDEEGFVLLDKWWLEISKNEWQKKTILEKRGGNEIWLAKVTNGVLKTGVRKVSKAFVKDLDLLSTAVYVYNEFDAVRDDLRDGRYHKHSKTATDYIFAAEGISTVFYEGIKSPEEVKKACGKLPYRIGVEPVIPIQKIPFEFEPMKPENYIGKSPEDFLNVPDDERKVTSKYQMKLNIGNENGTLTYALERGTRKPGHLDPAFDRRALGALKFNVEDDFFIHWGRMYYYEGPDGINRLSENPFPAISSRGIAKYIMHRLLIDLHWEDAMDAAENSDGYDYGVRRSIVGGEFTTNPLKATDLISTANPLGTKETVRK